MKNVTLRSLAVAALLCAGSSLVYAQNSNVTFQVDMNVAIDNCAFLPGKHQVSVPGSFGDPDWTPGIDLLTDDNEDGVYTATLEIEDGPIAYKFYATGPLGWENDPDRTTEIDGDTTLDVVEFNWDVQDFCVAQEYEVVFEVDMSIQVDFGFFDPDIDRVFVAGAAFGDWAATLDENELFLDVFNEDPWIYTGSVDALLTAPSTNNPYKFTKLHPPTEAVGWEDGENRTFEVTGTDPDNIVVVPRRFWNDIGPDDIMYEEQQIRLEVDLRAAYYYVTDNGQMPPDVQSGDIATTIESLFVNGPIAARSLEDTADDWVWGEALGQLATRQLFDDGTNGDVTPGDSVYTRMYTYPPGTERTIIGKFGVNALDNEAAATVDQHMFIPEGETLVRMIFGCTRRADGTFTAQFDQDNDPEHPYHRAYQDYLLINNNITPATCEVVRSGGGVVSAEPVGPAAGGFVLEANYPNPVVYATTFEYSIPAASHVRLEIFDVMGRRVGVLVDEIQQSNTYRVRFDASSLASGTYVYRLVAGDSVLTRRMTVVQ